MIEKLKAINPYDETEIDMDTNSVAGLVYENTPLIQKVNELVDAVNKLQTTNTHIQNDLHEMRLHQNKEPADTGELTYLQKENSDLKDELERIKETLFEAKYALEEVITPSVISHEQALAQQALDKINAEINNIGADNE